MYSGKRAGNPNYLKPYDIMIRHLIGSLILGVNKRKGTSRPSKTGGLGGGEGGRSQKKFSRPFRPQFGLKNKGNKGGARCPPGPITWIRQCINTDIHISLSIVCDIQLARKIKLTCLFIFCLGVTFVCIIVISRQLFDLALYISRSFNFILYYSKSE